MGPVSFFKKLVGRGSKGGVPATEPGQAVFGSDPSDTDAQLDAVTSITLRRMGTVLVQGAQAKEISDDARQYFQWSQPDRRASKCSSNLPYQYESIVQPGFDPQDRENTKACQDDLVVAQGIDGNFTMVCVFDGHGPTGGRTSAWLNRNYPKLFSKQYGIEKSMHDVLVDSFLASDTQLARAGFDISTSGSTGTVCLIDETSVIVGWVGDSKAVVAFKDEDGSIMARPLTKDHKPSDKQEEARIVAHGGVVDVVEGDVDKIKRVFDPERCAEGCFLPGIDISRSFGDAIASTLGVVCTPAIFQLTFDKEADKFLLVASDGLWDVFSEQEVVQWVDAYVAKHSTPGGLRPGQEGDSSPSPVKLTCQALAEEAQRRWVQKFNSELMVDDVSISIVWLESDPQRKGHEDFIDHRNRRT